WGFDGILVSDYFGIRELRTLHHIVASNDSAAKLALESGVDVELPFTEGYSTLARQVREGQISEALVDRAVRRVLRVTFLTPLFDNPYVDPDFAEKITNSPEHQQ